MASTFETDCFQLREREEDRIMDYAWPASHTLYSLCREDAVRETELRMWLTPLPEGNPVTCIFSPVRALRRL